MYVKIRISLIELSHEDDGSMIPFLKILLRIVRQTKSFLKSYFSAYLNPI